MTTEPVLFIANSVYQLMTAIHLQQNCLLASAADLLVTDATPGLREYLPRLRECGLFRRAFFAATSRLSARYMVGSMEEITEGYRRIDELFRWILEEELDDYTQVYFSNFDTFTRMLACRFYERPCEFILYEDGFSSYVIDYLRPGRAPANRHEQAGCIRDKVRRALLYEPRLAMRGDSLVNQALPKIRRDDRALRERLNTVFSYTPPPDREDFLFLEQSFRADGIQTNDLDLMRECRQAVGPGRFIVKPHPRNPKNLPFEQGLTRKMEQGAPWELFLLNEDMRGRTLITVCSNAALTGRLVFGMDVNTVMLYRLFEGKVLWKEDEVLARYLRRFHRQFAGENYYVPETVYELRHILAHLGGEYGR